jgi:drug/metabolite transporter (DMT)-like permease
MEQADVELPQHSVFGYFYFGATIVATIAFALFGSFDKMPTTSLQWGVLIYLGVIASGLGYFIWNRGACLVNAGALAVMNNLLVPAGLIVNIVIWNRDVDLVKLSIGGGIILLSLVVNELWVKPRAEAQFNNA